MRKLLFTLLIIFICISLTSCKEYKDTIDIDQGNTLIIAHRGLSGIAFENTEEAFKLAGKHTYYGIECDIYPTLDNYYVVCHDKNTKNIFTEEYIIPDTLYETIKDLEYKHDKFAQIPLLEDFIKICKRYEKNAIVELKSKLETEQIFDILCLIYDLDYLENTTFISFHQSNLEAIKLFYPDFSCQLLVKVFNADQISALSKLKIDIGIRYKQLDQARVDFIHSLGLKVNAWTVDGKDDALRLVEYGVDYLTSNILE